jgi:hypothetical protein
VLVKIGLAIMASLAVILGVAVAVIFGQITNARVEVASVRTSLSALNDRLGGMEKTINDTRANLIQYAQKPVEQRTEPAKPPPPPPPPKVVAGFYVTEQEAEFIREFLKVSPKNAHATKMTLWIRVPAQAAKPLPDDLVGRLEKLRGLRYAVDANNAIALIEPSTNIVIALI